MLPCFCISPSQLLDIIWGGTLLFRVTTRNSAPIPSSTRNRNSTWVGALFYLAMVLPSKGLGESIKKVKFVTKILFQIMLREVLKSSKNDICWWHKSWSKTTKNERTGSCILLINFHKSTFLKLEIQCKTGMYFSSNSGWCSIQLDIVH